MSNNANKRSALNGAAVNCRKILKNLKIKSVVTTLSALAIGTVSVCAAAVMNKEEVTALTASPAMEGKAAVAAMPEKEYEVTIAVDGKNIGVKCAGNVSDAIEAANVEIFNDDLINIGLSEPLGSGTEIIINRVNIVEEVQVEVIEYATKYQEDDELLVGRTETVVDGEEGEVETTFRHVYVDGELVSSDVIDEDITHPVDEVIAVGTMEEPEPVYEAAVPAGNTPNSSSVELDANGIPVNYTDVITGEATAYTASAGAITSTGKTAQVGYVAVDPKVIPYGTELYIVSADGTRTYGYAVAEDTGGAMRSGRVLVDLYMDTESECYNWGRRDVNVYILG